MKILIVFVDMIRPNRLSTFNKNLQEDTPIDEVIKKMGGTLYTNCFSPGPDTPRGLATFATGVDPSKNGCDTRLKWPRHFLNKEIKTIFDLFIERNYEVTLFSNPNERETGMYPSHITDLDIHNEDFQMSKYLSGIDLKDDHFVFVGIPDFHWSFEDFGYTKYAEKKAYKETKKTLDIVFDCLDKDDFDHVFMFSDHGFKFTHEPRLQPKYRLLDEDRTNVLMIHRAKGQTDIKYSNKLCSLADMFGTMEYLLNEKVTKGLALFAEQEREYVIVEDHINFAPSVNQNIELWSVITKDEIYIRLLNEAYLLNRETDQVKVGIIEGYDAILIKDSSFSKYFDEYNKVFVYRDLLFKQTNYMHGGTRTKVSGLLRKIHILIDIILERLKQS